MNERFPFQTPENKSALSSAQEKIDRRAMIKKSLRGALGLALTTAGVTGIIESINTKPEIIPHRRKEIQSWHEFQKLKPKLPEYVRRVDPKIENLTLPGHETVYGADTVEGKIVRTLQHKNITDAVESKWNLPALSTLAMVMEESTGTDLLPNAHNDGGFGLIHMQPLLAHEFGLKTYKDSHEMRYTHHKNKINPAEELAEIIASESHTRKELIGLDERLHSLYNIDAAGRMLASYMVKGPIEDLDPYETAIARYAGKYNFRKYLEDIERNRAMLADEETLRITRVKFELLNPNLLINGKRAGFEDYIQAMQEKNKNFGLDEYQEGQYYNPKYSDEVLAAHGEVDPDSISA